MDTCASTMQTILKAINSSTTGLRATLYFAYKEGVQAASCPVFLWSFLASILAGFIWIIYSDDKRDARNKEINRALHARNHQLAAQLAQTNDTHDNECISTYNDDDDSSSAVSTESDNEAKPQVTIHRTIINFTAPMTDVHFHSFSHGMESTQETLLPTMVGYGTDRLLASGDDSEEEEEGEEEDDDEDDDERESEQESGEDEA